MSSVASNEFDSAANDNMLDLLMQELQRLREERQEDRRALQQLHQLLHRAVPTGTILAYAGPNAPNGYLLCHGQAVSRQDYAGLFALIGVRFGVGDSVETFNVPDLRGRTVVGTGEGNGLSVRNLAEMGGEEQHTLTVPEIPPHSHGITPTIYKHWRSFEGAEGGDHTLKSTSDYRGTPYITNL